MPAGSLYDPYEGATLLVPSGPTYHLFIVTTKPCIDSNVALVNVTSIVPGRPHDTTCILDAEDHEFIQHRSWVYYRRARIESVATLRLGVASGSFIPKDPIKPGIFERICDGFLNSPFVAPRIAHYVMTQFSKS